MLKPRFQFLILLPVFLMVVRTASIDFEMKAPPAGASKQAAISTLCEELQITSIGVTCQSVYGFTARLDFPQINVNRVLAGDEYLPQAEAVFTEKEKIIGSQRYQNIAFSLRWIPVTPEFLQIYIPEYMPYWGNRVPYRLMWNTRYEECSVQNCMEWRLINETGEILPPDVEGLHPDLAADSNFNGVPAAFWNVHLIP
jgi:hypothetical protein